VTDVTSIEPARRSDPEPASTGVRVRSRRPRLDSLALPAILVAVFVVFTVLPASSATFPTSANLTNVVAGQSVIVVLALAALFPLVGGNFDFSIAAIASAVSVVVVAGMTRFHLALVLALAIGLLFSAIVGAFNGILVAYFQMNSFVTTLGSATLLSGGIEWYTHGTPIFQGISPALTNFGSEKWLGLPRVTYLVGVVVVGAWFAHRQTRAGRRLVAIGSNRRSAQLVGIRVARTTFGSFVACGLLSGVAGVLIVARNGTSAIDGGTALLFPALTAVFLGATAIDPGRFNVFGTLFGVFVVAVSVSGLTLAGAADWINSVFDGAGLIVAVGVSTYLGRGRAETPT
jgi:ribose transport system permease protein